MRLAIDNQNMESVYSKYGNCRYPYCKFSALKHQKKMRFAVDNQNRETAGNVGSFRIWIKCSETAKQKRLSAGKPNTETDDNVLSSVFGFLAIKHQKKCVLQLIIKIRQLPTMSAISV